MEKPITVDVQINSNLVRVHGDVALTVRADDNLICDVTEKFETAMENEEIDDKKIEKAQPSMIRGQPGIETTESEGLRRRNDVIAKKNSTVSATSVTKQGVEGEPHPLQFPTLGEAKESARQFAQAVIDGLLINFGHLPEWLKDNEYLHTSHRPPTPSFWGCFKSTFHLHTETFNIWTHMVGCIFFIVLAVYYLSRPGHQVHWEDKLMFVPFFFGAAACLGISSSFHMVACHSEKVGRFFNKLDFVGILLLIVGSFPPWLHYAFYCRPHLKIIYMSITLFLGACAMIFILSERAIGPKILFLRTSIFCAVGLFGVVPVCHVVLINGYHFTINWLVAMGAIYLSGAALYAYRIPERLFPGKCDILWQSHQIFHLCVIFAAIVHYWGITEMAYARTTGAWPC